MKALFLPTGSAMSTLYDVAIIGGGPAGLSAAIWLSRYLHSVVVVDSGGICSPDISRLKSLTGWQPQVNLRDGLEMLLRFEGLLK